jgi:hypothetical protein
VRAKDNKDAVRVLTSFGGAECCPSLQLAFVEVRIFINAPSDVILLIKLWTEYTQGTRAGAYTGGGCFEPPLHQSVHSPSIRITNPTDVDTSIVEIRAEYQVCAKVVAVDDT